MLNISIGVTAMIVIFVVTVRITRVVPRSDTKPWAGKPAPRQASLNIRLPRPIIANVTDSPSL